MESMNIGPRWYQSLDHVVMKCHEHVVESFVLESCNGVCAGTFIFFLHAAHLFKYSRALCTTLIAAGCTCLRKQRASFDWKSSILSLCVLNLFFMLTWPSWPLDNYCPRDCHIVYTDSLDLTSAEWQQSQEFFIRNSQSLCRQAEGAGFARRLASKLYHMFYDIANVHTQTNKLTVNYIVFESTPTWPHRNSKQS